jgi:hypothetical protein
MLSVCVPTITSEPINRFYEMQYEEHANEGYLDAILIPQVQPFQNGGH